MRQKFWIPIRYIVLLSAFVLGGLVFALAYPRADVPMPEFDEERNVMAQPVTVPTGAEIATVAGGCFWGLEDALRRVPGVIDTRAGYAGGTTTNPTYRRKADHREAVQVVYDPQQVSYDDLLRTFFRQHDPTYGGRGKSYRSFIFTHNALQEQGAKRVLAEVTRSRQYRSAPRPIQTQIQSLRAFYPAEEYHQRYYAKRGTTGVCPL